MFSTRPLTAKYTVCTCVSGSWFCIWGEPLIWPGSTKKCYKNPDSTQIVQIGKTPSIPYCLSLTVYPLLSIPYCLSFYLFFHSTWNQLQHLEIIWMTYHPIIFIYFIIDWLSMAVKSGVFYFILFVLHYSSKLFNHLNHLNKTKMVFYRHNCLSYNNLLIYKKSVLYLI